MKSRIDAKFEFLLVTLNRTHLLTPEERYSYCQEIARENEFGISYDELHELYGVAENALAKYYINYDQAITYAVLKDVLKKAWLLDKDGRQGNLKLLDYSNLLTKDALIKLGKSVGIAEEQVMQVLPVFAFKLAKCEAKFILATSKSRFFTSVTEFNNAFDEIKGKYETRYEL